MTPDNTCHFTPGIAYHYSMSNWHKNCHVLALKEDAVSSVNSWLRGALTSQISRWGIEYVMAQFVKA